MSRKRIIIISTLFAALVVSFLAVQACPRFKKIEKRGPTPGQVSAILPCDVHAMAALIGTMFNEWSDFVRPGRKGTYQNKFPPGSPWSRFFLFRKSDLQHSLFPSDEEIQLHRGADSFIERYVRIPSELKTRDFYLYEPSGDYYWGSEYFYNEQPAKFRCSFLIHLEPATEFSTKVEVFEYQPAVWVGEYLGLSVHALLPTMLHDIRAVEPTTTDRQGILTIIERAERSPDRPDSAR